MNLDPLAEFMRNQSPYNFGFNNPIYFSDYGGTIPWPVLEMFKNWYRRIDSKYGMRTRKGKTKLHAGIDINFTGGGDTDYGAPVVATHSGKVARITPLSANNGGGRIVVISSPDGSFETKYMHLSSVTVQAGQEISEGQTIGLIGGSAFGKERGADVHLHYEIHKRNSNGTYSSINPMNGNTPVDPQLWIKPNPVDFYNEFDYQMALFDYENEEARIKEASQPTQSETTNGGGREPVSPLPSTITPAPIVPIPTPAPGGSLIPIPSPNPQPAPLPIIIPTPRPDSGF